MFVDGSRSTSSPAITSANEFCDIMYSILHTVSLSLENLRALDFNSGLYLVLSLSMADDDKFDVTAPHGRTPRR
jgi:hypothetical protein